MPSTPRPASAPEVRRGSLVEDLHGHRVADPYRWLEAPASDPEVAAFVAAQNAVSLPELAGLPHRAALRERLAALWDHPRASTPWRRDERWLQLRNDGLQDQDVLWSAPADPSRPRGELPDPDAWEVLVDPNGWSSDGTASLSGLAVSDDGARVAVGRSDAGSDWVTWRVVETATGEVHPDVVPWSKFSPAAWLPSGDAFLYGAYDPPEPGQEHAARVSGQQVRLHRLGTDAADDLLVHARPDQPEWGFAPRISHDGRWLLLEIHRGTDPVNRVHVAPIAADGTIGVLRPLLDEADARWTPVGVLATVDGRDELVVHTDHGAPLGRVVAVDLADPAHRRELVAETPDRLESVRLAGARTADAPGWLVCHRLHHARALLEVHDPRDGRHLGGLSLPGPAKVSAVATSRDHDHAYVGVETFTAPAHVVACELPTLRVTPVATPGQAAAPSTEAAGVELVVEQVGIHHAGVRVPLFVVHRADVTSDGARPTVLWGYGGFDIPVTPLHRPGWRAWVEAGGVLAVACLRGGGEYGRAWHDDGRLARKQHVFDDALACAAWLTGRRRDEVAASALLEGSDPTAVWSTPARLGIEGRSNGGLLVGACLTQEPTAFGTAVPEVGVLDMVRFHRFTIGWAWTSDYGSPDDPDDLAVLLGYSPYHRVEDRAEEGRHYPATLVTTGDTDDRVVPAHSYKLAAALQRAQAGPAPILLRVDTSAGHGAGKPVGKLLDERADVLAFHAHHLGLPLP